MAPVTTAAIARCQRERKPVIYYETDNDDDSTTDYDYHLQDVVCVHALKSRFDRTYSVR